MTSTLRPESFRLPQGYASSGDPIEKNPFPSDDSRHRVWRDATRAAEQEVARIDVDFFACLERVEREKNAAEEAGGTIAQDSLLLAAWARAKACHLSMFLAKFDAWAKRGTRAISSDQQVEGNDRWLESFANGWIDQVSNRYASNLPPREASELLLALRNALAARVQFWRAEARRYRSEQETQEPTSGHVSAEATKSSDSVSSAEPTGDSQARSSDFSWRDVTIRFINEQAVQITVGESRLPVQGYEELGFAGKRSKRPNRAWLMLQRLARKDGVLTDLPSGQWTPERIKARKIIQELRKILRTLVKSDADSVPYADPVPYKTGFGYKVAFKIDPDSAFD